MGLQVEWYAANPGFHPIPPGYGLPWGTHEEQDIPGPLVFEAEFALATRAIENTDARLRSAVGARSSGKRKDTAPKWQATKTSVITHTADTPAADRSQC